MGILARATSGIVTMPDFMIIHGVDGVGKSTFAAKAPKPFFVGPESGTSKLNVSRLETKTFAETQQTVIELANDKHDYQTLVLDSIDWIEAQIHAQLCAQDGSSSMETACGGYGKAYAESFKIMREFIQSVKDLRTKKNTHVIAIAHSYIKSFSDPQTNAAYDRYVLKLYDGNKNGGNSTSALWREAVDNVLFANYETLVKEDKNKKTKAFGDGTRKLFTERRPSFDAKNRDGLPFELALDWDAYVAAKLKGAPESLEQVQHDVDELIKMLPKDGDTYKVVTDWTEKNRNNVQALLVTRNRLRVLLGQN